MSIRQVSLGSGGSGSSIGSAITGGTPGSTLFVGGTVASPTIAQDNQGYFYNDAENRLSLFTTLGPSQLANGTFTGSAVSWNVGSGWAYSSNSVSKISNGTAALSQSVTIPVLREYVLSYTVSNWTAGTLTPSAGNWTGTTVSANGTYTERVIVPFEPNATLFAFTPSNTARLTVDNVTLRLLLGTNTKSNLNVGGLSIEGNWANGNPGTTRFMTINNDGSASWTDYRFQGTLRGATGFNSSGGQDNFASGGNYFAYYYGNAGLTSNFLFSYNYPTAFVHYFQGRFGTNVIAGSMLAPTSTLQSAGGLALKVKRITASQSLDNSATHWLCDPLTSLCSGTPTHACSYWTTQEDCEKWDAHGGCSWFAGQSCSAFNNEFDMGTCSGTSGCTAVTASCSGAGDQSTCEAQDDGYGGSCSWAATGDCSPFDESTCGNTSGCTQNFIDCTTFFDDYTTCTGTTGCSWSAAVDCSLNDGTDQVTCETDAGCVWDSGSNECQGSCSGTGPFDNCTGNYDECSGTYYTGGCSGNYGAACQGTSSCAGIDDSTNCGYEPGCTWATTMNVTLPQISTVPDRTYWIYNDNSSSSDVTILPYSGDTVDNTVSIVLSNYKDGVHLAPLYLTESCSSFNEEACTPSGCEIVYCTWNSGNNECEGSAACSALNPTSQETCESTFNYCSGNYVTSKNWYIWSRT